MRKSRFTEKQISRPPCLGGRRGCEGCLSCDYLLGYGCQLGLVFEELGQVGLRIW
jgi:hypothetical protein